MPLKHSTETLLVFLLGIAIIVTGIVSALLPPITQTVIPWVIAFVLSIAYPLSLYPLFKRRRADYAFRALHFIPAGILVVRFLLQLLVTYRPSASPLLHGFTWGWSLPVVLAGFLAIVWFCFGVIRQWTSRLGLLALLFVPFLFVGVLGENMHWPTEVASLLWSTHTGGTGTTIVAVTTSSEASSNLKRSSDATEEKYRAELRRMARRQLRLAHLQTQPTTVHGATDAAAIAMQSGSLIASAIPAKPPRNNPPHLPSSGMGTEGVFLGGLALYCAVIHQRARRRLLVTSY